MQKPRRHGWTNLKKIKTDWNCEFFKVPFIFVVWDDWFNAWEVYLAGLFITLSPNKPLIYVPQFISAKNYLQSSYYKN